MSSDQRIQLLADTLKESFSTLIGQKSKKEIIEDISIETKRLLATMEADMYGCEILKCEVLWNTFTYKQKIKWYLYNKLIPAMGRELRKQIHEENIKRYKVALSEIDTDEFEECDIEYDRLEEPYFAKKYPKQEIVTEIKMKLTQPLQFIGLSGQISNEE